MDKTLPRWYIKQQQEKGRQGGKKGWENRTDTEKAQHIALITRRSIEARRERKRLLKEQHEAQAVL